MDSKPLVLTIYHMSIMNSMVLAFWYFACFEKNTLYMNSIIDIWKYHYWCRTVSYYLLHDYIIIYPEHPWYPCMGYLHDIHVWDIYLHLPQKSTKCRNIYTIHAMGYDDWKIWCSSLSIWIVTSPRKHQTITFRTMPDIHPPWNQHSTWKWMVGYFFPLRDGLFSGAMLVVGSDIYEWTTWTISSGVNMLFLNLNFRQYMKMNHISLVVDSWVFEPIFLKKSLIKKSLGPCPSIHFIPIE